MLEKHENDIELKSVIEQAELLIQNNQFQQANILYNKALEIYNEINDESGKANLLYRIALNMTNYQSIQEAIPVWEQSIALFDKLGDTYSKASIIHDIGTVMAKYGNVPNAIKLWNQSLELKETINDTVGIAASLINLAWAANREGDNLQGHKLNLQAAHLLVKNKIWDELVKVLINLAKSDEKNSDCFLAQALWLSIYNEIDADTIFFMTSDLLKKISLENELAPIIASAGIFLTGLRSLTHPKKKELQQAATQMLVACALVRKVPHPEISNWMINLGLNNSEILFTEFEQALNIIVGEENWLFERENFTNKIVD